MDASGNPTTGSWEDTFMSFLMQADRKLINNRDEIITFVGLVLLLCGIAMGTQYLWRRWLKDGYYWLYKTVVRNPWQWSTKPIRRLHRRWSDRNLRAKMAKWKRELVANIFYDSLTKACDEHIISKHDKRRLMGELATFFGISDLKRPNYNLEAIKKKIKANQEYKAGPAQEKPAWGGKPGENVVPLYEGLGHKWLSKRKTA